MKQQINFYVHSNFVKEKIFEMTIPLNPHKAMNGYYSKLWRRLKPDVVSGFGVKQSVKTRVTISDNKMGNECIMEFPGGIILTFPADATKYDISIILAQLEVLKMSCK